LWEPENYWRAETREALPALKQNIGEARQTARTVIEDQVRAEWSGRTENLDDLVLMRGEATPTYMIAVVVDDQRNGHQST